MVLPQEGHCLKLTATFSDLFQDPQCTCVTCFGRNRKCPSWALNGTSSFTTLGMSVTHQYSVRG
uniref:Uncharacterized protein n=1 Tax=Anguilla anguilla TaxID=7936 RepID=A0A0E9X8G3_ANGAN